MAFGVSLDSFFFVFWIVRVVSRVRRKQQTDQRKQFFECKVAFVVLSSGGATVPLISLPHRGEGCPLHPALQDGHWKDLHCQGPGQLKASMGLLEPGDFQNILKYHSGGL